MFKTKLFLLGGKNSLGIIKIILVDKKTTRRQSPSGSLLKKYFLVCFVFSASVKGFDIHADEFL